MLADAPRGGVIFDGDRRAGGQKISSEGAVETCGFRQSLNQTIKFIHDIDRARNVEDLSAQVVKHLSQLGAEHVIAGTYPGAGPNRRQQLSHALFGNYPAEWLERYLSRRYILKDPIMVRTKLNASPFFWDELAPVMAANDEARRIVEEAQEFNLVQGFSASIETLDGQMVGFSVSGRHFESDPNKRGILVLIASYAIGRAVALQQQPSILKGKITLSAREREALQWASEGKNDWEIGEIMKISEHGVDKHMRSARMKLDAINRTQAVAEAIRQGLIV
jgi:LuxR family transcriptional regulator, quorum-sensing system regulator BjaR1